MTAKKFLLDFADGAWRLHGVGDQVVTELGGDFNAALAQAFELLRERAPCDLHVRPDRTWQLKTADGEWVSTEQV